MGLPDISDQLELALGIPLVDEYPSVERANDQKGMLPEEDYPNDAFVFKMIILARVNLLQKLPSFATILSHEAGRIPNEKLPVFVAKLCSSNMGVVLLVVQFGEYLF